MTALLPAAAIVLIATVLCALSLAGLVAHHRNRKLIASYQALVAAKDGQVEAYGLLIKEQEGLIATQTQLIRAHEERAVRLSLLPCSSGSWGAPLQ